VLASNSTFWGIHFPSYKPPNCEFGGAPYWRKKARGSRQALSPGNAVLGNSRRLYVAIF
jgi:hypothetical protein